MPVTPYLFFNGNCDEAIQFYKSALGAEELMLMRFNQMPDQSRVQPETAEKVMHGRLKIADTVIFVSDGMSNDGKGFEGFNLNITVANETEAKRYFDALAADGQVRLPLEKTFFSPCFGMVADKFGVGWMVYVEASHT